MGWIGGLTGTEGRYVPIAGDCLLWSPDSGGPTGTATVGVMSPLFPLRPSDPILDGKEN